MRLDYLAHQDHTTYGRALAATHVSLGCIGVALCLGADFCENLCRTDAWGSSLIIKGIVLFTPGANALTTQTLDVLPVLCYSLDCRRHLHGFASDYNSL